MGATDASPSVQKLENWGFQCPIAREIGFPSSKREGIGENSPPL
jgi:hypothetical protein